MPFMEPKQFSILTMWSVIDTLHKYLRILANVDFLTIPWEYKMKTSDTVI